MRISGPHTHENLVLFFLHGPSQPGPVPLTLEEALAKGNVHLKETGVVSELSIENIGDHEVFIQSGDIVKGGRQDRVLKASIVLSPKSTAIPVSALCVESGRWAMRGYEDARRFSESSRGLHDRAAKSAIKRSYSHDYVESRHGQSFVWSRVAASQDSMQRSLGRPMQAAASPTSLQLSLESEDLDKVQDAYGQKLSPLGGSETDILGMIWAVNGSISGAEVYPSNALFRKMYAKNLRASTTEAISEKASQASPAPTPEAVEAFLAAAEKGQLTEMDLPGAARIATRVSGNVVFSEARRADGAWVHRAYVAEHA